MNKQIIARFDFSWNGRQLKAGETFEALNEKQAALLVKIGKARWLTSDQRKNRYERRDMVAKQ